MTRIVWHTDIVVSGQGMNVKVSRAPGGCARVSLKPDVPGAKSAKVKARFMAVVDRSKGCSTAEAKKSVERAVRRTGARWNRWHHESYGS